MLLAVSGNTLFLSSGWSHVNLLLTGFDTVYLGLPVFTLTVLGYSFAAISDVLGSFFY